ncbi:3-oxoacyl-(acyl carrier protein) synthase III [Kordia sp. SMS9]|uniref:hypothetical protein n=1 Tax=Kordia sp. SMS9 TaxID=2282170 RepID=UPI000E0D8F7E|nr:hypothetical protein [Kordia sp. SMS9]AXG70226.1 3-oxoacyl-(acyl carrier protein) synthase III [Kordia sp. SMS9]
MDIYMSGVSCTLGEKKYNFREIEEFQELIKKFGLTDKPDYWNWGNFHKAEKTLFEQAEITIAKTLNTISIAPEDIELVFFCCSAPGTDFSKVNTSLGNILVKNNISQVQIIGQNIGGCTSIFHVLRVAEALISQKLYKNILVVASDKVPKDSDRMYQFGIYSDCASSFLLSSEEKKGYKLKNVCVATDTKLMSGVMENRDSHFIHLNEVHSNLRTTDEFDKTKIEKVFMTNVFKPIMNINLSRLGYKSHQHFYDNIATTGHCFATDPLLNLITYENNSEMPSQTNYLLAAIASGHAAFASIEKV